MRTLENITYREKLGKRSRSKGLVIVLMYIKKKLWESNQVFLCIPCAVGSLCSRKNLLMEKEFENWKNFFRKAVKSPVPQAYRSSDRSCRCSPSWEQGQGQPNSQSKWVVFLLFPCLSPHWGQRWFLHVLEKVFSSPWLPCFVLSIATMFWNIQK